ncbi:MAG: hypothetical protein M3P24_07160, partial [Gemmatimonadota bacterium]|nr:hypothetical protein [Gemmatimonadota bacterium]
MLIIDPDAANGNVDEATHQLQRYYAVQQAVRPSTEDAAAFFSTRLNDGFGDRSFRWEYPNQNQPFSTLINYTAQRPEHQQLLDLLYDSDDLSMTFEKGYVGRAHIGSLDLLGTLQDAIRSAAGTNAPPSAEDDALQLFVRALRAAATGGGGAKLMVLGSIFGGTGASGLPTIPPLIRSALPLLRDKIEIACVPLAPYFSFPEGGAADPNSQLHQLATQAALYHYAYTETGYRRVYLLGAPERPLTNERNWVGGSAQRNKAHYVELAAALAAAHFFDGADAGGADGADTQVFATGAKEVAWGFLPHAEQIRMRERLVSFTSFCILHAHFLHEDLRSGRHQHARWTYEMDRETKQKLGGQETELAQLHDFGRRYLEWTRELERSVGPRGGLLRVPEKPEQNAFAQITAGGVEGDH